MKRFVLLVLCIALMAPCAWAGDLSAVYTYDGTDVTKASSELKIEAGREVRFIYKPSSYDTAESYTIAFKGTSVDISMDMMPVGENFSCLYSFDADLSGTEIGISMDAPGFMPCSADITTAWPFELNPPKLTMKTSQTNEIIKFNVKGDDAVSNWNVNLDYSKTMVQASYTYDKGLDITPRIAVSSLTSEGDTTLTVKFTNKADSSKSFERRCFITISDTNIPAKPKDQDINTFTSIESQTADGKSVKIGIMGKNGGMPEKGTRFYIWIKIIKGLNVAANLAEEENAVPYILTSQENGTLNINVDELMTPYNNKVTNFKGGEECVVTYLSEKGEFCGQTGKIKLAASESSSTGGGSGGGGCDAGLAGLGVGLLALLPFAARKKR